MTKYRVSGSGNYAEYQVGSLWRVNASITNDELINLTKFKALPDGTFMKLESKYDRHTPKNPTMDVYDVLEAFDVRCPALQHLIKKALCVGIRGHKDTMTDLRDIEASAKRAINLELERNK